MSLLPEMGTNTAAIALDIGTSSVRAAAFDDHGAPIAGVESKIKYCATTLPPGAHTLDPLQIERSAFTCLTRVHRTAAQRGLTISHIGIGCFWHSCYGSRKGDPVTEVITWADRRPAAAAAELRALREAPELTRRTGCPIHPSYFPARLRWIKQTSPEIFSQVDCWLSIGERVFERLTGQRNCPIAMASATGLFNQDTLTWDKEALELAGISSRLLPEIMDQTSAPLMRRWLSRWPAFASAQVAPPIGDGAASNIGSGCLTNDRAAINIGTSAAIRVLSVGYAESPPGGFWRYRYDSSHPLIGTAFSDAGSLIHWLSKTLRLPKLESLDKRLVDRSPGDHGLTLLPFWGGERAYRWRERSQGMIRGMTLSTQPEDILLAALEAVALRLRPAVHQMVSMFGSELELRVSGGGIKPGSAWSHILADALGRPIHVCDYSEATARGVAWAAMHPSLDKAPPDLPSTLVMPNQARALKYEKLFEQQQAAIDRGEADALEGVATYQQEYP